MWASGTGLRRSLHLLVRRWVPVVVIFIVLQLVYFGLHELYSLYYDNADGVLIVLPLVQIVVDAFMVLLVDLLLIFLYEQARRATTPNRPPNDDVSPAELPGEREPRLTRRPRRGSGAFSGSHFDR